MRFDANFPENQNMIFTSLLRRKVAVAAAVCLAENEFACNLCDAYTQFLCVKMAAANLLSSVVICG